MIAKNKDLYEKAINHSGKKGFLVGEPKETKGGYVSLNFLGHQLHIRYKTTFSIKIPSIRQKVFVFKDEALLLIFLDGLGARWL